MFRTWLTTFSLAQIESTTRIPLIFASIIISANRIKFLSDTALVTYAASGPGRWAIWVAQTAVLAVIKRDHSTPVWDGPILFRGTFSTTLMAAFFASR